MNFFKTILGKKKTFKTCIFKYLWYIIPRSGEMAERLKAHAWKVCIRQKRIEGSNPSFSAIRRRAERAMA